MTATLTSQLQITIPAAVRNDLKVGAGDQVLFFPTKDGWKVKKAETWESLAGSLKPYAKNIKLTKKVLNKAREEFWTERYKNYLKKNDESSS